MLSLFKRWIRYSMVRKGGSSPMWTAVGVLSLLNTLRKRYAAPKTTTILSDGIRPGEVIEIRHTGKPSKDVRSERASKAALLAQFRAVEPTQKGRRGRSARKLRKKLGGTVISEMASGKAGSTTSPVTHLVAAAASVLAASDAPASRRQLRKATKAAKRVAQAAR